MQIKSISISFDPKNLERQLKKSIIDKSVHSYAKMVEKKTRKDLHKGIDVNGKSFKPIQPVTKEIRELRGFTGTKPLIQSGNMAKSIKLSKKDNMKYTLKAQSYGNSSNKNVHQTGFRLDGGIKQEQPYIEDVHYNFTKVGTIPARPWFPDQESTSNSKEYSKGLEKVAKKYFKSFNKAFSKGRLAKIKATFGG